MRRRANNHGRSAKCNSEADGDTRDIGVCERVGRARRRGEESDLEHHQNTRQRSVMAILKPTALVLTVPTALGHRPPKFRKYRFNGCSPSMLTNVASKEIGRLAYISPVTAIISLGGFPGQVERRGMAD